RRPSLERLPGAARQPDAAAALVGGRPDARRVASLGVERHYVREVHRALLLDHAADLAAALGVPHGAGLLVALLDVEDLDEHASLLRLDAQHLTGLPLVLAVDDLHLVALAHPRRYVYTSGSRESYLMKFL